ncbi:DUF4888 domain-containing protein [Staphylococcus aureus]|uniref:DUF4888 domain-containing protein n=1 Tax=Staphylococcus aureus TaxID=1280 RepID=UPI00202F2EC1|nr:DUF4888 domain-containing protein [Staphylococcus aureus]MCM0450532.1 DUF4888 domain-containing protein [Staphylococcus aureus]MCM0455835.1 DUF4888 domain-containing protein [Staphylococcus aureus]MCM0460969.1 DUF4888 domain-containing protein [Staphylococcus aureus]MCM0468814.1 DUF4888 domain-containing protein [Staphylococcus aureus]MCM0473991.1 DUF4888 domain-containing protein [Staphylococcus aureus]
MNTKFLGKTLVASALVLTTLGTGLHSSYLGLDTNKVVKTAKAEENMTEGQLWKKVKNSLIDSNIISGNENETVKVTFTTTSGQSNSVESTGNQTGDVFSKPSNFSKLSQIDITKKNIPSEDFNTRIDANETWKTLTQKLKGQGLVTDGDTVTIHSNDKADPEIKGKVGSEMNDHKGLMLNKRDINKITIE